MGGGLCLHMCLHPMDAKRVLTNLKVPFYSFVGNET